jgi:glycerol-3-phosphate dehydrogenase (NAD(P)+)
MSTTAAVMGTGSWGTAFAAALADAGTAVTMWGRRADIVVLAVPSQTLRANLADWSLPSRAAVVSLMKGVELGTTKRMSEVIMEVGGGPPSDRRRVRPQPGQGDRRKQPAASVVACADEATAERVAAACRPATSGPTPTRRRRDRARRCGEERRRARRRHGRGHGHGRQHQGLDHHPRAGRDDAPRRALGAEARRPSPGLAGVGDLIATCMSPLSRNRTFGVNLGRG